MSRKKFLLQIVEVTFALLLLAGCSNPVTAQTGKPVSTSVAPSVSTLTIKPTSSAGKVHLIFDDDGSRDGTAALLFLLSRPEIFIDAISVSYGEGHPEIYVQHIGHLLDNLGIQGIPLGVGQDAPLTGSNAYPDWLRQLSDNFWNIPLPNAGTTISFQNGPELMVSTINQANDPITLFISGAFTNLAQALRIDPNIRRNISAVYIMGGAVYSPGNISNLIPDTANMVAEWNIFADPQAAKEVFESGLTIYLIPLDATEKVMFKADDIRPWHSGDKKADFTADLYDIMFDEYGFKELDIFDLLAAVIMSNPHLCEFEPLHLDIIIDAGSTLGQTVVTPNGKANTQVCLKPNVNLSKQELNDTFLGKSAQMPPAIDPLIGTWSGSVFNNGLEMNMSVTIEKTCQLMQKCGVFDISTVSCSGYLTWIGMDGDLYRFEAGDKTQACGTGNDYLLPQTDGTLMYIGRGDYGETKGILHKMP